MSLAPSPSSPPRLPALTSLRFFAAFWVAAFHLLSSRDRFVDDGVVSHVVVAAPVAVSFFFVLSGFVLTLNHIDASHAMTTSPRSFFRARFARVMPVYWLSLLIAVPTALGLWKRAGADPDAFVDLVTGGVAAFFAVQSFSPAHALALNPPAWSVCVEVLFYVLFPVVAPRLARLPLWPTLIALWLLATLPGVLYLAFDVDGFVAAHGAVRHNDHAFWLDALKYHPLVRLPELCAGVVIGRFYVDGGRVSSAVGAAAALALVGIAALGLPYTVQHNGLLLPLFALLILGAASTTTGPLTSRLAVKLGEASYALYLLHVPLLLYVAGIGARRTGGKVLDNPVVAAVSLGAVVVVSAVVFQFIEEPLRRRLRR